MNDANNGFFAALAARLRPRFHVRWDDIASLRRLSDEVSVSRLVLQNQKVRHERTTDVGPIGFTPRNDRHEHPGSTSIADLGVAVCIWF
jgi:hypothetical protein